MKEVCVALAPFLEIGVWHCFAMPFLHLTAIRTLPASEREGEQRAHTPHLFRWLWFSRTSSMDDGSLRNNFRTGWTKLSVELRWTGVAKKFDGSNEASMSDVECGEAKDAHK